MHKVVFGNKSNPAVIFMHGWGGSNESWGIIPKVLAGFGFFVVVVDFLGFGKSELPPQAFSVEDYSETVVELVRDLGLKQVSLVGHSFGGRVAIKLAGNKKLDIKKVVLVDSAGIRPRRGLGYKIKVARYKRLKAKVKLGKINKDVLEKFGSSDYNKLSGVMRESFLKIVNEDLIEDAKRITNDTLLVWGRADKDTPLYMARKLKKAIKKSELVLLNGGHFCYLEHTNKFIDLIYEFLTS